ncbi:MAG: hypothetical protein HKN79_05170 [Flavobacteriales bacterium]|nr:hypothetical protein [Flavobacteriales bacterium]
MSASDIAPHSDDSTATYRNLVRAEKIDMTSRMVRVMAHEIRNPLTNIDLALANLESAEISEDDRFFLDLIQRNSGRINDLLTELLESVRPISIDLEEVSLHQVISESLENVSERADSQEIKLDLLSKDEHPTIRADRSKLLLALDHLLLNAIQAMPDGGKLSISAKPVEDTMTIEIHDTGIGIDEKDIPHIFDPLFSLRNDGKGLGLTKVQNILAGHGWDVIVSSTPGKGTSFIISLS